MSISINAIFRFDINNFKWLWVYFIVSFFRPTNLLDVTQNTEKYIYILCYQPLILWTNTKHFLSIFLRRTLILIRIACRFFSTKIHKYEPDTGTDAEILGGLTGKRIGRATQFSVMPIAKKQFA